MFPIASFFEGLFDHLRRLQSSEESYQWVLLNMSALMPYYRQSKFQQVVYRYLHEDWLVAGKSIFVLPNKDLAMSFRATDLAVTEQAFYDLRGLMSYDPLLNMPSYGQVDGTFMQFYDLDDERQRLALEQEFASRRDYLLHQAQQSHVPNTTDRVGQVQVAKGLANPSADKPLVSLLDQEAELARVGKLAERFRNLDVGSVLRRTHVGRFDSRQDPPWQFFCSVLDPQMLKLMSYQDQRVDADDQLLNRYLGHIIQLRLWDYLIKLDDRKLRSQILIPVHPELILHTAFQQFDESLSRGMAEKILLQFHMADIYADYRLFHFVSQQLRRRGYRLCLGDVRYEMLPTIDLHALNMEYLFLQADSDWPYYRDDVKQQIAREIADIGAERICLQRVDQRSVLEFGQDIGIKLFSGAIISHILRQALQGDDEANIVRSTPASTISGRSTV